MQTSSDNEESESGDTLTQQVTPSEPSTSFANSLNVRIGLGIYGILLPIVCHLLTVNGAPTSAEWQSGEWTGKVSFVLSVKCGWPVFPFLIFAMICMGMVIYNETNTFSKTWVRLGIFSGVFVCGWYLFAFSSTLLETPLSSLGLLLGAAVWVIVVHSFIWLVIFSLMKYDKAPFILLACVLGILFLAAFAGEADGLVVLGLAPCLLSLILSTPLAFLVYLGTSIRILILHVPARRFTLSQLMVWVTWLTGFAAALQKTIALSFAEYSQLPLEPPGGCYVATAASKGYPAIVGSRSLPSATDQPVIVNRQLATFKAAELTLRVISPKAHRWFRQIYNRLGPVAAAKLRGPLSATIAYLCLKPAEWLCRIVLQILLGRQTFQLTKKLYHARSKYRDLSHDSGDRTFALREAASTHSLDRD